MTQLLIVSCVHELSLTSVLATLRTMNGTVCVMVLMLGFSVLNVVQCEYTVTMPDSLQVVSGSCVLIPCKFTVPTSEENKVTFPATAVWRRTVWPFTGSTDVFNSSRKNNLLHGEILGDLLKMNCTSILYNFTSNYADKYFFRLETGIKLTFKTFVNITAMDTGPKPTVSQSPTSVPEGKEMQLECTVSVPCPKHPPNLTWTPPLGNSTETMQMQPDGTFRMSSVLRFVSLRAYHKKTVNCSMFYPMQPAGGHIVSEDITTISVLYGPRVKVEVMSSGVLTEGQVVTLSCYVDANPAVPTVIWFRESQRNLTKLNQTETHLSFTLSGATVGLYHCQARNNYGMNNGTVQVNISHHPYRLQQYLMGVGVSAPALLLLLLLLVIFIRCRRQASKQCDESQIYANIEKKKQKKKVVCCRAEKQKQSTDKDEAVYNNDYSSTISSCKQQQVNYDEIYNNV